MDGWSCNPGPRFHGLGAGPVPGLGEWPDRQRPDDDSRSRRRRPPLEAVDSRDRGRHTRRVLYSGFSHRAERVGRHPGDPVGHRVRRRLLVVVEKLVPRVEMTKVWSLFSTAGFFFFNAIIKPVMIDLNTETKDLPRIGTRHQQKLAQMEIYTAEDLLRYFPHRYEDFSNLKTTDQVKLGEKACLRGVVTEMKNNPVFRRKLIITEAVLTDQTGSIKVVWFNQPYLINQIDNQEVILAGKISEKKGALYLASPSVEKAKNSPVHAGRIVPIYPESRGVTSRWLRYIIKSLIDQIDQAEDPLPESIIRQNHLGGLIESIKQVHFPDSTEKAEKARQRFAFEELFYIHLRTLKVKMETKKHQAVRIPIDLPLIRKFVSSLPFQLTPGQKTAAWRILQDMDKGEPMSRLLEGDVGSGKTAVMMIPALNTAAAKKQTALMAPTAVLAQQHHQTFQEFLKDFPVRIGLLTGEICYLGSKKSSAEKVLNELKQGKIDLLIGTHALIQERVKFRQLALVVIDEQHRFGVRQRARLMKTDQRERPHLLSMTATPIPRTLALTVYGDLDLSLLQEKPQERAEVATEIIKPRQRQRAYQRLKQEVEKGRQAFVVCPRIEADSEEEQVKTVIREHVKLSEDIFPDLKVAKLHGQMKAAEKQRILKSFRANKINILVTTSVIEVGVDIPNATAMIIEGAERFGLAQLHQMRGRVGRSNHRSYCFLFITSPDIESTRRLAAMVKCHNGFKLAEKDLSIRGPGSLAGTNQWGLPDLVMANLKDLDLVARTRQAARDLINQDPLFKKYPLLRKKVSLLETAVHLE